MKTVQSYHLSYIIKPGKTKNAKAPLYCRIAVNGKRAEISLKRNIDPSKWSDAGGRAKGNSEEARLINNTIDLFSNKIHQHYNQMLMNDVHIDSQSIKNSFLGLTEKKYTLIETFNYHNERMKPLIGIDVELGTYKKFETVPISIFLAQFWIHLLMNVIQPSD